MNNPVVTENALKKACARWQSERDNKGSSAIRAAARDLTGVPHYFEASYLGDHLKTARDEPEVMDAARILLDAVSASNPQRTTASGWQIAHALKRTGFAGRGVAKKDGQDEDAQIWAALETGEISMPLWGVSLDETTARQYGGGNLGFLFQIEGPFRGVAAWEHSGIKRAEYEIITGGNYTVHDIRVEPGSTVVILHEKVDPIAV